METFHGEPGGGGSRLLLLSTSQADSLQVKAKSELRTNSVEFGALGPPVPPLLLWLWLTVLVIHSQTSVILRALGIDVGEDGKAGGGGQGPRSPVLTPRHLPLIVWQTGMNAGLGSRAHSGSVTNQLCDFEPLASFWSQIAELGWMLAGIPCSLAFCDVTTP